MLSYVMLRIGSAGLVGHGGARCSVVCRGAAGTVSRVEMGMAIRGLAGESC